MSYHDTIQYLYNLQKHGTKFGLENIAQIMSALDSPQDTFLSVHVAGTNGKGSTSAILASILKSAGLKVGLFTSPHLVSFTERIRIDGGEIEEHTVVELTESIRNLVAHIDNFSPTFFEVVTAIAFQYFSIQKVDVAVIEVGMGGRLDATNIITPEVSVITNVSFDHREFLGDTLKEISREKAGIIKEHIPVVVSTQEPEAREAIQMISEEKDSEIYWYGQDFFSELKKQDMSGILFDYWDESRRMNDLTLPLIGEFQMQNASVAIKASMIFFKKAHPKYPALMEQVPSTIKEGVLSVRWPGRAELVNNDPPIVIDGAHNPAAAIALSGIIEKVFLKKFKKIIMILGIMADKDIKDMMRPLLPLASEIIFTSASYSRASAPENLARIALSIGFCDCRIAPTVKQAVETAENLASSSIDSALILVTGSFYTIGEVKEALGQKGVLTRLRE